MLDAKMLLKLTAFYYFSVGAFATKELIYFDGNQLWRQIILSLIKIEFQLHIVDYITNKISWKKFHLLWTDPFKWNLLFLNSLLAGDQSYLRRDSDCLFFFSHISNIVSGFS